MAKSCRKVVIDLVRRQVAGLPRQTFAQNDKLLPVARTGSYAVGVSLGKAKKLHGGKPFVGGPCSEGVWHGWSDMKNCYNPNNAPLAQLARHPSLHGWGIVRATWATLFGLFVFLNWAGCALVALLLGQLGEIAADKFRTTDGSSPTDGAFHKEGCTHG